MPLRLSRMLFPKLTKSEQKRSRAVRLGFVPLSDCAPLVIAQELGLFRKYDLEVQLRREVGWATLRDRICYGELDAAHSLAPLAIAINLGLGAPATECLTGLVLNLEGNGITLTRRLAPEGKIEAEVIRTRVRSEHTPLLLGIPFLYSAHHFLLRAWLLQLALEPERAARFVVVPPPQMPAHLKAGVLDGYCVGEPWNSKAVLAKTGHLVATSRDLRPGHPEKVLLVRREFAEERAEEHLRLIAALLEACAFCAVPGNGPTVARLLAGASYLKTRPATLEGTFDGTADGLASIPTRFYGDGVNEPSPDKAAWIAHELQCAGVCSDSLPRLPEAGRRSFRSDIFQQSLQIQHSTLRDDDLPTEFQDEHALA